MFVSRKRITNVPLFGLFLKVAHLFTLTVPSLNGAVIGRSTMVH